MDSSYCDKRKMRNTLAECSALVLIIISVWGIACGTKNIWPFGQLMMDIGDMAEECVPMYTHLWDALHGRKALLFDWYTGLGNNMAGPVLYFGLISPFNVFFLFIERSAIEASMSVYIAIKLIATGFSMRFLIKKWFPGLSGWMRLSFGLLYVFSAFNMQYYYAPMWLDVSFMFPLVIYGYFLLMNGGRKLPYIFCLATTCMMSFQHTYMLLLMLLFLTGILPLLSGEKYRRILPGLLGATLVAMFLASWIWVPGAIQILSADRAEDNHNLMEIWNSVWIFFTAKWMKLLNMGIPLGFFLAYARKHYKEKSVKFFGFVIVLICAPILLESTNLLWHGGSYQGYTMRFSYMVAFWILTAGAYAYNGWIAADNKYCIYCVSLLVLLVITGIQYFLLKKDMTVYKSSIPAVAIILIIVINMAGGYILIKGRGKIYESLFLIVSLFQILTLAVTSVFTSGEKENSFFAMGSEVSASNSAESQNPIFRIKSLDVELSHNYPLIMCRNAVSNYFGVNSKKQLEGIVNLGYAKVGYRMSDYGGTLLSDALLGVNEVISRKAVNESLYKYQDTYKGYSIFNSLYGYGQGIKVKDLVSKNRSKNENPFNFQNQIAKAVSGRECLTVSETEGNQLKFSVDRRSVLYLYAENEEEFEEIVVSNQESGETYKLVMPESGWLNGILELGTWENATLQVRIKSKEIVGRVFYALLPLQEFTENEPNYCENFTIDRQGTSLNIKADGAETDDYLFLPFYHDNGWKCIVNDIRTEIKEFAGVFMAIPLQAGENEIYLSFRPKGLIAGILMTMAGIILGILLMIKRLPLIKEQTAEIKILWIMDELVFASLILVFYVIPVVVLIKELIILTFRL